MTSLSLRLGREEFKILLFSCSLSRSLLKSRANS